MRLVLDTNAAAISGLLWHGNPGKLIDAAFCGDRDAAHQRATLAELRDVGPSRQVC